SRLRIRHQSLKRFQVNFHRHWGAAVLHDRVAIFTQASIVSMSARAQPTGNTADWCMPSSLMAAAHELVQIAVDRSRQSSAGVDLSSRRYRPVVLPGLVPCVL